MKVPVTPFLVSLGFLIISQRALSDDVKGSSVITIPIGAFRGYGKSLTGYRENIPRPVSSKMTISLWIITGKYDSTIVSLNRKPNRNGGEFRLFIDGYGKLGFEDSEDADDCGFCTPSTGSQSSVVIADNRWHHIAFVKKGLMGYFYTDGEQTGTISSEVDIEYKNSIFCTASDCRLPKNESLYLLGMFDDLAIFDRSLSAEEVKAIYSQPPKDVSPVTNDTEYDAFVAQFQADISQKVIGKHVLSHVLETYPIDPQDLILEFGVWMASSINNIALMYPDRWIFGFDSFEGLPEDWSGLFVKGSFNLDGKLPKVRPNVFLIKGWFSDTIPQFKASLLAQFTGKSVEEVAAAQAQAATGASVDVDVQGDGWLAVGGEASASAPSSVELPQRLGLLHVDCDLYSSTRTVFDHFKANIRPGTVIVFDELLNFDGFEKHEMRALYELVREEKFTFDIIGIECVGTCQPVAIVITGYSI